MINFFRNTRKKLADNNRFLKYSRYAIGEIMLVVIGILIALQINNWNEGRKENVQEQKILLQLKLEYNKNLEQLEEKILMRIDIIQACTKILGYIDQPINVELDSIIYQLSFVQTDPTFDPIKNDLIESGNLHLIRNDSLKLKLSNWSSEVYQLQELELEFQKIRTELVIPFGQKTGLQRNIINALWKDGFIPRFALNKTANVLQKIGNTQKDIDVAEVLNNVELEGIVSDAFSFNHIGNIQSMALKSRITDILKLIDSEIE